MARGDLKVKFGQRVREFREAKGLTQDELAERIDRSVDTVSNIERGIYATRIEVAARVAQVLGVDFAELFEFGDSATTADREHRRVVRHLTTLLSELDMKNLLAVRDVIEASVKLARGRRGGRSHR